MKSVERHKLETNALAHGLELYIERYRPYVPTVAYSLLAIIAALFIWSYISGSSAAQRSEAWDSYNFAVGSQPMNLEHLRQAAEAYPGTAMQQMADVTWADGQVFSASNLFIANRTVANEALTKAASAYQRVIQESSDDRIKSRAQLGLARVYEMQGDIDKAHAEYEHVIGPFAKFAKTQAERLASQDSKDTYAWLKTAQPPRPVAPVGPGTPGQQPEFSPGDLSLPNAGTTGTATPNDNKSAADTFDALLKDMQKDAKPGEGDRYKSDQVPPTGAAPADPAAKSNPGESKSTETPAQNGDSSQGTPPSSSPADSK